MKDAINIWMQALDHYYTNCDYTLFLDLFKITHFKNLLSRQLKSGIIYGDRLRLISGEALSLPEIIQ